MYRGQVVFTAFSLSLDLQMSLLAMEAGAMLFHKWRDSVVYRWATKVLESRGSGSES